MPQSELWACLSSSTPTSTCSGTWYNAGNSYTTQAACSADALSRYGLK
jgi:hypothetical protein